MDLQGWHGMATPKKYLSNPAPISGMDNLKQKIAYVKLSKVYKSEPLMSEAEWMKHGMTKGQVPLGWHWLFLQLPAALELSVPGPNTPHTHTHTHTQRLPINVCESCQHPLVELQNIISKITESLFTCAVSQHFLIEALRKQLNQHYWISIGHLGSWSAECKWSWLCVLVGHNNEMCLSWKYLHLVIVREWISWINQSTEPD